MTTAVRQDITITDATIDPKEWTDRDLLRACIRKDDRAWRELMRRYDGPLRGVVYKRLRYHLSRLPSDYREDVMAAFYLRLVDYDMSALRCFTWEKGSALFKWLSFLVMQSAVDYLRVRLQTPECVPLRAAIGVPDEGGVLATDRRGPRGSLSERVRKRKARAVAAEEKRERRRS